MGVSKSKEVKLGEQQYQSQFPGQQSMQAAGFGQATFQAQPQLAQQLSQQLPQQMSQQLSQQLAQQGFGQQQPQGGFSSFPPFPPMPQQGLNNLQFPNLPTLPPNAIFPSNTSSAFPVQFANQQLKPLIPGYAPAPDRRAMLPPQQQQHEHEQNEFSMGKYYVDQQGMPQMQGMPSVKARKH